jgi:hypothetical protein
MASLAQQQRTINARSKSFALAIRAWMLRFARDVISDEMRKAGFPGAPVVLQKGDKEQIKMANELFDLINRFGLRQAGGKKLLEQTGMMQDFFRGRQTKVKGIAAKTRKQVKAAIRKVIQDSVREIPRPSPGEVARRLRTRFEKNDGLGFGLTIGRASVIARTELAIGQNIHIIAGYKQVGVKYIEWVSYKDGRSGERHHEAFDGMRVELGKPFVNPITGAKLRWPGDSQAPAGEVINCRCTTRPVRSLEK